eukprot:9110845-Lingulodinium_polyedra.AAC.1
MLSREQPLDQACSMESVAATRNCDERTSLKDLGTRRAQGAVGKLVSCTPNTGNAVGPREATGTL